MASYAPSFHISSYEENCDILERVVEGCESEIPDSLPDSRYSPEPLASSTTIQGSTRHRSRDKEPLASSTMIEVPNYSSDEDSGCGSSVCTFSISEDLEDSLITEQYLYSLDFMACGRNYYRPNLRRTSTRVDLFMEPCLTTTNSITVTASCCGKVGFKNPVKAIKKIFKTKKSK